jgi:hypothetical protein
MTLITFDENKQIFHLSNASISYLIGIEKKLISVIFILVKRLKPIMMVGNILQ